MRILISGSGGLVGSALREALRMRGHAPVPLVRRPGGAGGEVLWEPAAGRIDTAALEGIDAVIHLAGESIAARRWNADMKDRIRNTRVHGTAFLCHALTGLARPPKTFLCASAVGYYGDQGDKVLAESAAHGHDFLASVCREWEEATQVAANAGIRVVNMRFGTVLSRNGGMLARMVTPARWGLGAVLGSGGQYMSWIAIDDVCGVVEFLLENPLSGPVNVVSPNPVTNREFTRALAKVLHRPAIWRIPAPVLRLMFGELGDTMLASVRAVPERLMIAKYTFRCSGIEETLRKLFERD